ncbi:Vacuolar protein sorting-associated protein 9A [Fusarium oxysporum f. sp. albedinis]|nr:Vacuolar protein sorting-associated protein 9A [Fusarium oxysporum f. sp. albedinis]
MKPKMKVLCLYQRLYNGYMRLYSPQKYFSPFVKDINSGLQRPAASKGESPHMPTPDAGTYREDSARVKLRDSRNEIPRS